MSIDMRQFHQIFFEETAEHLANMENLLLGLDATDPDTEQLNAIFRAAHSIKGSAGTFGFADLQDLTHILENLLDRVRKGELHLHSDMIGACLDAVDVLRNLLAAHQDEAEPDRTAAAAICQRLQQLTEADAVPSAPTVPDATTATGSFPCFLPDAGMGVVSFENFGNGLIARSEPYAAVAVDDAYGFFEPLPESVPASVLPTVPSNEPYGFFEPLPESVPASVLPTAPSNEPCGFFEPLPEPVPASVPQTTEKETRPRPATSAVTKPTVGDTTIRVGVDKVDTLINLAGELVVTQAMLAQSVVQIDPVEFERLHNGLLQLERNTRDLQEAVMSIRMMPMSVVFARFPRVVRDTSQKLGKQVELKLSGEHTELDKGLIERIIDPLTHLVRNSLDHGIETPEVRIAKGKQPVGTITLSAYHQSGNIVIEVGDDGAGLSRDKILAKARERGLAVHDQMSDHEVFALIFEPGFSTADQITEISGRGVGMDVVRKNIAALNGRVDIDSLAGVGTRMTVRLPLTLAILDGLSVAVGSETYVIPLSCVAESLRAEPGMIRSVAGVERLLQVRDEYLPIIALHEAFRVPGARTEIEDGIVIIVETDGAKAALFVDAMIGQYQVVIKNLETNYRKVPGVSGATIMGDGRVALILDVAPLVDMACRRSTGRAGDRHPTLHRRISMVNENNSRRATGDTDAHSMEFLTFTLGPEEYAIDILKVQEIRGYESPTAIANAPAFIKGVINLRGTIVPVIDMRIRFGVGKAEYTPFTAVIILSISGRTVGMVVDSVSDVSNLRADQIRPTPEFAATVDTRYIYGLGTIDERMLIIVDIEKLMLSSEMALAEELTQAP